MSRTQRMHRLQAFHGLYRAVCALSESLFDQALEVCFDEREAAFLASCSLVRTLERERCKASPRRLIERINVAGWESRSRTEMK